MIDVVVNSFSFKWRTIKGAIKKKWYQFIFPIDVRGAFSLDPDTVILCRNDARIVVGKDVLLNSNSKGYHGGMPFPTTLLLDRSNAYLQIGDKCRIHGAYIHSQIRIVIGSHCVIAAGTNIIDSNGHELYSLDRTVGRDTPQPISIGDNVWIGLNSTILKGTSIGNNSVVAAGSVVKGSFPNNSLIQGSPAKLVKILSISEDSCT